MYNININFSNYLYYSSIGIGKTTLMNEICLKWARDKDSLLSNDYDLVILIRLRTIQERSLHQVMIEAVGSEAAYDELLTKSDGKKCLIILEGLDEVSAQWQQNDTLFCKLIENPLYLSHANILVTSRPHACIHLHKFIKGYSRTIEIVGFDKPQIKEYAELYFHDSSTTEKFTEQVNNNPHISSLCYVPLCLNMVLECFRYNSETVHITLTELYQSFIISKVDEHVHFKKAMSLGTVQKNDEQIFKNLKTVLNNVPNVLSSRALETMFLLSKLAYKSYSKCSELTDEVKNKKEKNQQIVFTNKDLADCDITNSGNDACGLLKATNTLFATGNTAVYTFNHLSVQEYFCALHISLLSEDQQLQLLKDHIIRYPHVWPFYAGITKLRSADVLDYLCQRLLQENQLSKTNFIDCSTVFCNDRDFRCSTIAVVNSIYEAQLSYSRCKYGVYSLHINTTTLNPYDCMSISYSMSVVPFTHLFLQFCSIGDRKAEILARSKNLQTPLKVLDLTLNGITHKGMESVAKIIKSSTNLTHFSVQFNPIGDGGIQLFPLLKFKHLIQLNIKQIKMTEVGTSALSEWCKLNDSLQSLDISYNKITDNGLMRISDNLPDKLVRLIVKKCWVTYNGAVNIAKLLVINKTLKYLDISENNIGDDGISAISDSLHVNTTLIQLVAHSCRFKSKGAESVAKMLQANKILKYLDISYNNIGADGTKTITSSIQTNTTLIQLKIFKYKCTEGLTETLKINKTLKELAITYSNDTVTVLKIFCESDCELRQLTIATEEEEDSYPIKDYVNNVNIAMYPSLCISPEAYGIEYHSIPIILYVFKVAMYSYS